MKVLSLTFIAVVALLQTSLATAAAKDTSSSTENESSASADKDAIKVPPKSVDGVSSFNWCGQRKWIALTFDDRIQQPYIDDVLADLEKFKIPASFYLSPALGGSVDPYFCTAVQRIVAAKHSINSRKCACLLVTYSRCDAYTNDCLSLGSNLLKDTYTHANAKTLSAEQLTDEIKKVEDLVYNTCGVKAGAMKQFRPPFGSANRTVALQMNQLGYTVVRYEHPSPVLARWCTTDD